MNMDRKLVHLREECLQLIYKSLKLECQRAFNYTHIPFTSQHIRRLGHCGTKTVAHTTQGSNVGNETRRTNIANKQKHRPGTQITSAARNP